MSDCPKDHHECAGTARLLRVAAAMGAIVIAKHYFSAGYIDDGMIMPVEWTYEARRVPCNDMTVTFDAALVEGDAACDEVIAMELEHLR